MIKNNNMENANEILDLIKLMLKEKNIDIDNTVIRNVNERNKGRKFSFNDHIEGLVFSLLSKQRPWKPIKENRQKIKEIFFNFNKEKIISMESSYFETKLKEISCGNRSLKEQMLKLKDNISMLEKIEAKYGNLDDFFKTFTPRELAKKLSDSTSEYKLKQVGFALALEYIRNLGIDASKPDVHLCRIVAKNRLNFVDKEKVSDKETFDIIAEISKKTNYLQVEIDSILWHFCAEDYGNICNSNPQCKICTLNEFCNFKHA